MKQVGPYVVESVLGRGAMGQVFLVHHPELDQRYALKVLPHALMDDDDSYARFEREMSALGQVDGHPGIVRVHTAGRTEEGQPYYVMELVEGQTLKEALKEGMPRELLLETLEQVADALDHAHVRGLIHRDVKPANVLLGHDGVVRLTDFGLARITGESQAEKLTRTGDMVGTPAYMAPEQASTRLGEVGPWTDVWGVGAILYEALAGHVPYPGQTSVEIYGKLVEGYPIPPPSQGRSDVPPELEALCMRCLERRPGERIQTAGELRDLLRRLRLGAPESKPRLASTTALLGIVAGLSLLLALLAVSALALRSLERSDDRAALEARVGEREAELSAAKARSDPAEQLALLRELLDRRDPSLETGQPRLQAVFEQAEELSRAARVRVIQRAWEAGDVRAAREHLDAVEGSEVPERAWILALSGDPQAALSQLPTGTPPAVRARLASWAGDRAQASIALDVLALTGAPRARALSLELSSRLPGLEPVPARMEGAEPGWQALVRAEEALHAGDVELAGAIFAANRKPIALLPEVQWTATGLALRIALAQGDVAALREATGRLWLHTGNAPLARAEALGWAVLATRLTGGPIELAGVERDPLVEAQRFAPCGPERLVVRGAGELARSALAAGEHGRAAVELRQAGVPQEVCDRSLVLAELWLARSGRDGPLGILLTRAAELSEAALAGGDRVAGQRALTDARRVTLLRSSPAALVVQARAARAAREASTAVESAQAAAAALPSDALAHLELARSRLGLLEKDRLAADVRRAEEVSLEEPDRSARAAERADAEAALARALGELAGQFRQARKLARADDPLEQEARLEGAAVWIERAHRLDRAGGEGAAEARAACRTAAREELGPLLSEVRRDELLAARRGIVVTLRDPETHRDAQALEREVQKLAEIARAATPRARAAAALAASCATTDSDARTWAQAYLALAGDFPARVALELRLAERSERRWHDEEEQPERRKRRLESTQRAFQLAPRLPRLLISEQGTRLDPSLPEESRPGLALRSALDLAEAIIGDPDELDHARRLVSLLEAGRLERCLEQLQLDERAGRADPAAVHLARALLLLEVGGDPSVERAEAAAAEARASLELAPSVAARLLRARALARLDRTHDSGHDLACARAQLPWSAPGALLELAVTTDEAKRKKLVDDLLASGYVANMGFLGEALGGSGSTSDEMRRLIAEVAKLTRGDNAPRGLAWAGWFHREGYPRTCLLLRLRAQAEEWNVYDLLGEQPDTTPRPEVSFQALEQAFLQGESRVHPAIARSMWWNHRAARVRYARDWGKVEDGDAAQAQLRREHDLQAVHASCLAPQAGPLGAPALPASALFLRNIPCEGRVGPEREARRIHPDGDALRSWWARLHLPEQAAIARARAWHTVRPDPAPPLFSAADLADPWGRSGAILRAAQDGEAWVVETLMADAELDETRLALDREAAFARQDGPEDTYRSRLLHTLRWCWTKDEALRRPRLELVLLACQTPQVRRTDSDRFDRLAGEVHLDLSFLDRPERRGWHMAEARRLLDKAEVFSQREIEEEDLDDTWRRFRLLACEGNAAGAKMALEKLIAGLARERPRRGDLYSSLWHEPEACRKELEQRHPAVRDVFKKELFEAR